MTINLQNISVNLNNNIILKDINFDINSGEVLSLVGPNGAGKSSLINVISGDVLPSKGKVIYDGKNIKEFTLEERSRKRSVMSQFSNIAFDYKVKDIIEFGWVENSIEIFSKMFNKILLSISKLCDVYHLLNRSINTLSGGEIKRVQLAKTLLQLYNPSKKNYNKYAFMDEPLANLDLFYEIKVLKIIQNIAKKQGVGILLVIHDLNLATKFSDKIALIDKGKLISHGVPIKVMEPKTLKSMYNLDIKIQKKPFRVNYF